MTFDEACRADYSALVGSPKQIAWAENIRDEVMRGVARVRAEYVEGLAGMDRPMTAEEQTADASIERAFAAVAQQADATWWIDRRGQTAREILQGLAG